jgi:hypothetical protein
MHCLVFGVHSKVFCSLHNQSFRATCSSELGKIVGDTLQIVVCFYQLKIIGSIKQLAQNILYFISLTKDKLRSTFENSQ